MAHKNLELMLQSKKAAEARRQTQDIRVVELKLVKNRLSSEQLSTIALTFLEAKWLYNSILETGISTWTPAHGVWSLDRNRVKTPRTLPALPAHVKQNIHKQLRANTRSIATQKKMGRKVGAIRFTGQVKSIEYSTGDLRYFDGPPCGASQAGASSRLRLSTAQG